MTKHDVVLAGKSATHDSAREHVSGRARYVDDMESPAGLLHVAIGTSPVAHGTLSSIDLKAVWAASGVVDVITFDDLPHETDIAPVFPGDPLLVDDEISHVGQPLFAVAAKTHQQARWAVLQAQTVIEEKQALLDLVEAMDTQHYVRPPHQMRRCNASGKRRGKANGWGVWWKGDPRDGLCRFCRPVCDASRGECQLSLVQTRRYDHDGQASWFFKPLRCRV